MVLKCLRKIREKRVGFIFWGSYLSFLSYLTVFPSYICQRRCLKTHIFSLPYTYERDLFPHLKRQELGEDGL